jgi:hypothetical protein
MPAWSTAANSICARAGQRCRLVVKMKANLSRFAFTFRYWQPIAGSADQVHLNDL